MWDDQDDEQRHSDNESDREIVGSDTEEPHSSSAEIQPFKKSKYKVLWSYFAPSTKSGKVSCKDKNVFGSECKQALTDSTTAVRKHLASTHPSAWRDVKKRELEDSINEAQPVEKKPKAPDGNQRIDVTFRQLKDKAVKYTKDAQKKKEIDRAVAAVLSIPSAAVNLFTHPLMRELFFVLDPKYPLPQSFHGLKGLMSAPYHRAVAQVKDILATSVHQISITADIWTDASHRHAYLGTTVRFVSNDGSRYVSLFLGLVELFQSHTKALVRESITEQLDQFGIDFDKAVFKVVSDNGSNFIAAFRDKDTVFYLYGDGDNDEVQLALDVDDNLEQEAIEDQPEYPYVLDVPKRVPCIAHAGHNHLKNSLKAHLENNNAFKTIRLLIAKFRKSDATQMLSKLTNGKALLMPSRTRWGYWVPLIGRFLLLQNEVRKVAAEKEWEFPSVDDLAYLSDLHKIIQPFYEVLLAVQEKTCSISKSLYNYRVLEVHLRGVASRVHGRMAGVIDSLSADLVARFTFLVDDNDPKYDPCFVVATALDPNTAYCLDSRDKKAAKEKLYALMLKYAVNVEEATTDTAPPASSQAVALSPFQQIAENMRKKSFASSASQPQRSQRQLTMFNRVGKLLDHVASSAPTAVDKTVNTLEFWRSTFARNAEYESFKPLVYAILSVPATSSDIERIFSHSGMATKERRNRAEIELLNMQLVPYINSYLNRAF